MCYSVFPRPGTTTETFVDGLASFLPKILRPVEKEFYHTSNTNRLIHQEINTSTNKEKMDSGGDESPANGVGSNGFNGLSFDVECI